ncbi:MAG: hypothetical protein KDB21_03985 [Acidimicrobiales bacterium]|nr:hypothetical protein [Acidimicrobiales bacterium]
MALICFASAKGSPGSTLTALAVAAAWPTSGDRRKLLLEADASGGTLALRYGLGLEPGLVTFAVAAQRHLDPDAVWNHGQTLPGGLPVIVAPDNPDRAASVLTRSAGTIANRLAEQSDLDVIVDLGRLGTEAPSMDILRAADVTLMVARPTVEQLQPATHRLRSLPVPDDRLGWVLIGQAPHSAAEVREALGYDVAGVIADDPRGAAALEGGAAGSRLRRSALARSATALAETLAKRHHPLAQQMAEAEAAVDDDKRISRATFEMLMNGASDGR